MSVDAPSTRRIGLAAARNAPSVEERLQTAERMLAEAKDQDVAIVCFPEAYIPGLRGFDFPVPPLDQRRQEARSSACGRRRSSAESPRSCRWSGRPRPGCTSRRP